MLTSNNANPKILKIRTVTISNQKAKRSTTYWTLSSYWSKPRGQAPVLVRIEIPNFPLQVSLSSGLLGLSGWVEELLQGTPQMTKSFKGFFFLEKTTFGQYFINTLYKLRVVYFSSMTGFWLVLKSFARGNCNW
jgi:hypothetical protein